MVIGFSVLYIDSKTKNLNYAIQNENSPNRYHTDGGGI